MRFNKLVNLYKGLTKDLTNFFNGKVNDISTQLNRQSTEPQAKASSITQSQVQAQPPKPTLASSTPYGLDTETKPKMGKDREREFGVDSDPSPGRPFGNGPGSSTVVPGEDFVASRLFNQAYSLELIYKASESDKTPQAFHKACDGIAHTVVVARVGDFVFGGYTDAIWSSERIGAQKESKSSFLFSVNNRKKYYIKSDQVKNAIYCRHNCGPVFGKGGLDLFICNGSFANNGSSPCSYETESQSFGFINNEKYQEFEVDDYDVFRVMFR